MPVSSFPDPENMLLLMAKGALQLGLNDDCEMGDYSGLPKQAQSDIPSVLTAPRCGYLSVSCSPCPLALPWPHWPCGASKIHVCSCLGALPFSSISVELSAPRLHDLLPQLLQGAAQMPLLQKVFLKLSAEKSSIPSHHQHPPPPCYALYCPLLGKYKLTKNPPEPEGIQ